MNTSTPVAPTATRPKPRDPDRVISDALVYLGTEEACGATHIRIDVVRQLLRIPPARTSS